MELFPPERIDELVADSVANKSFRPTVFVIATHTCEVTTETEILVVRSNKEDLPLFWPVQGALEPGEDIGCGAVRELHQETGIGAPPDFATILGASIYEKGPAKGGFSKGNLLVGVHLDFCETAWRRARLDLSEVSEAMMLPPDQWAWATEDVLEGIPSTRQWQKLEITKAMLDLALGHTTL